MTLAPTASPAVYPQVVLDKSRHAAHHQGRSRCHLVPVHSNVRHVPRLPAGAPHLVDGNPVRMPIKGSEMTEFQHPGTPRLVISSQKSPLSSLTCVGTWQNYAML